MSERPVIDVEDSSEFGDSLVISCFPSEGFVSSIVAHFLVDRLGLELVGGIRHSRLPVCLVQDGSPLPTIRLYSGVPICNVEKCDKVVLIASEIQIPPDLKLPIALSLIHI